MLYLNKSRVNLARYGTMRRQEDGMARNGKIWKEDVRRVYGSKCVICGSLENIQIHHVIFRSNQRVKRYVPNGVPLCHNHHSLNEESAHQNPEWFLKFIIARRGLDWWDDLLKKSEGFKKAS